MKRTNLFFVALIALIAIGACSTDETVQFSESIRPIDFRTNIGTRAQEATTANLQDVRIISFVDKYYLKDSQENEKDNWIQYFNDVFKRKGSYFTSVNKYYWYRSDNAKDETPHNFLAFSPATIGAPGDLAINPDLKQGGDELTFKNSSLIFTVKENIKDQVDFVFGTTGTTTEKQASENDGAVAIDLAHQLAQIEVKAKNTNANYKYSIKGLRFGRVYKSLPFNTFSTTYGSDPTTIDSYWELDNLSGDNYFNCEVVNEEPVVLTSELQNVNPEAVGNAMLIPQGQLDCLNSLPAWDGSKGNTNNGTYISVLLRIETPDGKLVLFPQTDGLDYGWASVGIKFQWVEGNKYIYNLDFSEGGGKVDPDDPDGGDEILGGEIKFKVEVQQWDDALNQDIDFD